MAGDDLEMIMRLLRSRFADRGGAATLELAAQDAADIVETLNTEHSSAAAKVLAQLPLERAIEVLDEPELRASTELVRHLPVELAVTLLQAISADRAAEIFRELDEPLRSQLLDRVNRETRSSVEQLVAYPADTAGSLMTPEFVSVPFTWTIDETLQHIQEVEPTRETVYAIYILDPADGALLRTTSLRRLITGDSTATILSVAPDRDPVVASPLMDREEVARLIAKYNLLAVPVVDLAGRILGIVTVDDVIDAMIEEGTEDVQKLGGMEVLDRAYTEIGFVEMIRKRGGWLAVLFMGEMLTASIMQHYEAELTKAVVLTLFIPLIMSSGGNSGSQATSLLVRSLALREVQVRDWWRVALKEIPTGVVLGAILGIIGIARIALWQMAGLYDYGEHWGLIAITIGAALVAIVAFGTVVGALLPFILKAVNFDPASASAPLVATLVDVTGIVIYFSIALFFLSGTIL